MKTLLVLLALCAFTLSIPAETQADRVYEGLWRSAHELDERATRLRDRNPGMSDDEAADRVAAEVRTRRDARDEAKVRETELLHRDASAPRAIVPESENTDGIVLLIVVGIVVAFFFSRRDARRVSN